MKKLISVLLCVATLTLLLAGGVVVSFAEGTETSARTGVYAYAAPIIDGEVDVYWEQAEQLNLQNESGYVKVLWDETGLYVLVWARSESNQKATFVISEKYASWMQWWQTGNECEGNYAISVTANGLEKRWYDRSSASAKDLSQSGIRYAVKTAEKGVYTEVYFPLRMEGAYIEDAEIAFAVHLASEADQNGILVGGWDSTNGYCYKLSGLGTLRLAANACTHEKWLDADCCAPRRCASCEKRDGDVLNPENHAQELKWEITEETHCQKYPCCGVVVSEATAHTWSETPKVEVAPTCTEKGTQSIHCTACGAVKKGTETEVDALGHDFADEFTVDVEPTCTQKGTKSHHCTRCDATSAGEDVAPLGHEYGDWTVMKKPTCDKEGKEHTTCKRCWTEGEVRVIPKLEHTGGDWIVDKEATPGVAGKRHKLCSVCNQVFDEEEIPALPVETEADSNGENQKSGGCKGYVAGDFLLVAILLLISGAFVCKRKLSTDSRKGLENYMNQKKAKRSLKKSLIGVLSLLLAVLLCACTPSGNQPKDSGISSSGEEVTTPPIEGTVGEHILKYTIITPDSGTEAEKAASTTIYNALGKGAGRPKSDFVLKAENIPSNNNEILIGNTNRASSKAAMAALEDDMEYTISFFEGEVVIVAKTEEVLTEAVRYFVESILTAPAANFPNGFVYKGTFAYPLSAFFGLPLTGLKIVYEEPETKDAELMQEIVARLQSYIRKNSNAVAEITTSGEGNIKLVIDSTLGKDDYAVDVTSSSVTLRAGTAIALEEAVKAIESVNKAKEAESFTGKSTIPLTMKDIKDGSEMDLVWHDEFDGDVLDSSKWNLHDRMYGNEKLSTSSNKRYISVQDGEVVMNAYGANGQYTTNTTLTTMDRMSFQYGYIEIRAKIPNKRGAFPAFWFQSAYQHRTVNYMTEVDMFELYRSGYLECTMHKWYMNNPGPTESSYEHDWNNPTGYTFPDDQVGTLTDDYHLYGMGWTPTEMYFTVDRKVFATYDITNSGDFCAGKGQTENGKQLTGMAGFQDPLMINFTNWLRTSGGTWQVNSNSEFPFTFAVDWIRLYQKPGEGTVYNDRPQNPRAATAASVPAPQSNTVYALPTTVQTAYGSLIQTKKYSYKKQEA